MTPREKAIELLSKFNHSAFGDSWIFYVKGCAIVSVNEVLYALGENKNDPKVKYWKKVKKEIEKI